MGTTGGGKPRPYIMKRSGRGRGKRVVQGPDGRQRRRGRGQAPPLHPEGKGPES